VILDSDDPGEKLAANLKRELYVSNGERLIMVGDIRKVANAEVEDLIPPSELASVISRYFDRAFKIDAEEDFADVVKEGEHIVPQAEQYAADQGLVLERPGWKACGQLAARQTTLNGCIETNLVGAN
jgi:hypothetical protein